MTSAPARPIELLLPFYGDPRLLREAVESVLTQTSDAWRLLVLDDCYPDPAVGTWLQSLNDARVTYERNEANLGANRNYQKALSLATEEYVVIMGADDRLLPDYLARMARVIEREALPGVIQPGVRVIDENGAPVGPLGDRVKRVLRRRFSKRHTYDGQAAVISLMHGNWTYFPSLVWHRPTIANIGFRPYHVVQDLALLVDVLKMGGRLVVDDPVTFEYRRHRTSDSSLKSLTGARFEEERAYLRAIQAELGACGWTKAARAARLRLTSRANALSLLPRALAAGKFRAAGTLIAHAFGS